MFRASGTGFGYWLLRQMILSVRKNADKIRLTAFPKSSSSSGCRCLTDASARAKIFCAMKLLIGFISWCILLVLSWPLAIAALVLFPLVWIAWLPFRLVAIVLGAVFELLRAILFLPARLLGYRPGH
jgi:hypothetical protein